VALELVEDTALESELRWAKQNVKHAATATSCFRDTIKYNFCLKEKKEEKKIREKV
jgi:hypothetical protein